MGKKKEKDVKKGFTRRVFLKGSAVAASGLALGSMLPGCSDSSDDKASASPGTAIDTTYTIAPKTDLLYIGGGMGTMTGIHRAVTKENKTVRILDKGPWRAGGATGYNWDVIVAGFSTNVMHILREMPFLTNQELTYDAMSDPEYLLKYQMGPVFYGGIGGESFPRRNTYAVAERLNNTPWYSALTGTPLTGMYSTPQVEGGFYWKEGYGSNPFETDPNRAGFASAYATDGGFPRHVQDYITEKLSDKVEIVERTMVTNIVVNNGVCTGVVGYHLPTGKYIIYPADVVLLAAGGCTWFCGWETVSPHGSNSPDNTADVEMALFRRGCAIGDAEHSQQDYTTGIVSGFLGGYNLAVGGDCTHPKTIMDKNGKNYYNDSYNDGSGAKTCMLDAQGNPVRDSNGDILYTPGPSTTITLGVTTAMFLHHLPERFNNGHVSILTDPADPRISDMREIYARNFWLYRKAGFDTDSPGAALEAGIEMWEHGGAPVIDNNLMTEVPGLFNHRGSGVTGINGGVADNVSRRFSHYAVKKAVEWMSGKTNPGLNTEEIEAELNRLEEIRTRNISGGLRPHVVRQRIQHACGKVCGTLRIKADLEAARDELARIRVEDLPKQVCLDKSRTYNMEWKHAIENFNLLDMAELFVNSSLAREESRTFYRPDFPRQDDINFACPIVGRLENNQLKMSKRHLPYMDPADVANLIALNNPIASTPLPSTRPNFIRPAVEFTPINGNFKY